MRNIHQDQDQDQDQDQNNQPQAKHHSTRNEEETQTQTQTKHQEDRQQISVNRWQMRRRTVVVWEEIGSGAWDCRTTETNQQSRV